MKIICLDVGEKRIGVARADSETRIAISVGTIEVDGTEFDQISHLAKVYSVQHFVVGLPRNNSGQETAQSLYVRQFAKKLVAKIPTAKIHFQDESLTSVLAEKRLKSRKKPYQKGDIDAEAATIILQDFLENFREYIPEDANTNFIEKKAQKAAMETHKVKHKTKKTFRKVLLIPPIVIIVVILAVAGVFIYRNISAEQRTAEYARLEAEMEADVFQFTIIPGETIFDVQDKLAAQGYSEAEITAAFNDDYNFSMFADKPANTSLEGYLMGETFEFYGTATVSEILITFLENTQKTIDQYDLKSQFAAQGLSLYEGITLASIVQKESNSYADSETVAQVFYSRLENGMTLGSDVTVSYAVEVVDPDRQVYTDNSAALQIDSCYNTRLYTGLPCGPISNPSISTLLATANPSDTDYLFFLTGDDGTMYYSYTVDEHNQKAALYCQTLCDTSL